MVSAAIQRREKTKALLRQVAVLAPLSDLEMLTLADSFAEETYADGYTVCKQGEDGNDFYLIKEGLALCFQDDDETGEEVNFRARLDFLFVCILATASVCTSLDIGGDLIEGSVLRRDGSAGEQAETCHGDRQGRSASAGHRQRDFYSLVWTHGRYLEEKQWVDSIPIIVIILYVSIFHLLFTMLPYTLNVCVNRAIMKTKAALCLTFYIIRRIK